MKEVTVVTINGAEYLLSFDWNAFAQMEEKSGKSLIASGQNALGDAVRSASGIRLLVWGALQRQKPGMSLEDAGDLVQQAVDSNQFDALSEALGKALTAALPKAKDKTEAKSEPPENPTTATTSG